MFTYAKIGLLLLQIANRFLERADRAELRSEGYQLAVAEQSVKTVQVVGLTAKAFGEVAGWTDQQVEDTLTRPPSPSQP